MHPNPSFRQTARETVLCFARDRGFGILAVSADGPPHLAHVPFLLSDDGTHADLHLVRSNPICRAVMAGAAARLEASGPDGYVSPDWYGLDDQVPTWNYVAVALTGILNPLPPERLADTLAAQSAAFEGRLQKRPWTMDKMSDDARARLMRMILPFRLTIEDVQSTWKLNQNKPDTARRAAARQVQGGIGADLAVLAALMGDPPPAVD